MARARRGGAQGAERVSTTEAPCGPGTARRLLRRGGRRRGGAAEDPRPQERVQRHTVEHIVDFVRFAPMVQIVDALVPQMVNQLQDITRFFDTLLLLPEQVIEVPKILVDSRCGKRVIFQSSWHATTGWLILNLFDLLCLNVPLVLVIYEATRVVLAFDGMHTLGGVRAWGHGTSGQLVLAGI